MVTKLGPVFRAEMYGVVVVFPIANMQAADTRLKPYTSEKRLQRCSVVERIFEIVFFFWEEGFQQLVALGRNFFQGETRLRLEIVEENIFFEKEVFILDLKI